jgi:4-hydroxyphenylacetate 3-monooxygenase
MPIRTAAQYLDGLRDERHIQIDGERIKDVTTDRRFRLVAETMAGLFAMQHDEKLAPKLTYASPSSGDAVGMTHLAPKSKDELVARNDAIKIWMDETCGMLGRSPDYKNVMWSSYGAAADIFDRDSFKGGDNVRNYHEYVRENDLVMTHVLVNPQVDRSKPAHLQESDITAHITKETDAGIIINGARMVATLCALADEIVVMPAAVRWQGTETIDTTDYSFGFAIPTATPGLKFVCRPSFADMHSTEVLDYPFSARYDESDGLAIFEDVFVPWEKVFIHRDPVFDGEVTAAGKIYPHMVMQSVVRATSKAEFMMALTFALARTTKIDQHNPVQLLLAETMSIAEFCRTCRIAAEAEAFDGRIGRRDERQRRDVFPVGQRRRQIAHHVVAPSLRCCSVGIFRAAKIVRAILSRRSQPHPIHVVQKLRCGRPYRTHLDDVGRFREEVRVRFYIAALVFRLARQA